MTSKARIFLLAGIPLLATDRITKSMAYADLQPVGIPHQAVGNVLQLTLLLNRDAALNLTLGRWSRWGFAAIAVLGVVIILRLLRQSAPDARLRAIALGWIAAGAIGNLVDRIRWDRGVVDFIDVGIGLHRFWTFNVADASVTIGAAMLAVAFVREHRVTLASNDA